MRLLNANIRVGQENGAPFFGGSRIVGPDGATMAEAPMFQEALIAADIDLDQARRHTPLVKEARLATLQRELAADTGRRRSVNP
jgi:predicted amidohydrolase